MPFVAFICVDLVGVIDDGIIIPLKLRNLPTQSPDTENWGVRELANCTNTDLITRTLSFCLPHSIGLYPTTHPFEIRFPKLVFPFSVTIVRRIILVGMISYPVGLWFL